MRRIFAILAAAALTFSAAAQDLTILHLNDTHSHIDPENGGKHDGWGGVIEQAAYIDSVRCADGRRNVLLLHAGDFSQGTSYFTELKGDMEIDVINAFGYDAVTLGNHEFDNGMDELARRLSNLDVPVVCANYDFTGTPLAQHIKPYVIVKKAGKKIGIIGLLTDVSTVVDSRIAAALTYIHPVEVVNRYASYLKDEKDCDMVICLSHLGFDREEYTDCELAAKIRNVDVIVGGHSHTHLDDKVVIKDAEGEDVVIVQAWKWGRIIGKLSVDF